MVESGVIELEKGVSEIVCAALSIWQIMLFLYIKEVILFVKLDRG